MSPLLDSGSHGLRPVRNPLISGALQQCGKKFLVESDSDNRAGPSPDWGPPRSRTGQPLTFVANLSLVNPSLDLIITNAVLKKKAPIHDSTTHEKLRITLMDANNSGHPTLNLSQARTHELNSLSQDR